MIDLNQNRRTLIPLGLFFLFTITIFVIYLTKPEANRSTTTKEPSIEVEILDLVPQDFPVTVQSYGLVTPLTQSNLVSRVAGEIAFVDESFRGGGFFKQGQILVSLDTADYDIDLEIAKAQVAEAESRHISEIAQAEEARHDWKRSGRSGEPPALAVREPQLKAAEAGLKSAQASVARAQLNLSRTQITAPYAGRVLEQMVDLGQVISVNTPLAQIYASEAAEISLPVKNSDLSLLQLPDENARAETGSTVVTLTSQLMGNHEWQAKVVRVAGAINNQSRQLHVVARIEKPFEAIAGKSPLKIGEYLSAKIKGKDQADVLVIPNKTIYQGNYVYVLEDDRVYRRDIRVRWTDDQNAIVESGLQAGDRLVLTVLGQVASGTLATVTDNREQPINTAEAKP